MSHRFDSEIFDLSNTSGVHVVKPLSLDDMQKLSKGIKPFSVAFWSCPTCGHLTSEIELIKEQTNDENKWHKATSIVYNSNVDRSISVE